MDESLAKIRHERSKKDFPTLKLEDGEYVEVALSRARIIFSLIMLGMASVIIIVLLAFLLTLMGQDMLDNMGRNFVFIILVALLGATIIVGFVTSTTFRGNKLYVTNRRVIQMLMNSLVSSSKNEIDLASVEDVSFHQDGLLPRMFHYGTLRLATVGDETTYTFKYSDVSQEDIERISKMVTMAKKKNKQDDD